MKIEKDGITIEIVEIKLGGGDDPALGVLDLLMSKLLARLQRDFPGVSMAIMASRQCEGCGGFHDIIQYGTTTDRDAYQHLLQRALDDTYKVTPEVVEVPTQ